MERRTKHRILGIIVVIALVFLLLPFMQHNKDIPEEVVMVNAPPFPEQKDTDSLVPDETIVQAKQETPPSILENKVANEKKIEKEVEYDHSFSFVDDTVEKAQPVKSMHALKEVTDQEDIIKKTKKEKRKNNAVVVKNDEAIQTKAYKKFKTPVITDNGLFDVKMPIWVVQVGTFNSKLKAMRLVNQLRSHSYSAFLQQIQTNRGVNHLVFVGPELQNQSARALANDIEKEYHLRGMVVSYKPMAMT